MNFPTNQQIINSYLNFTESKGTRKTALNYFFDKRYFGYSCHVFEVNTQVLMDYFKFLKDIDLSINTKKTKWFILKSFLDFCMEYYNKYKFFVVFPKHSISWNGGNHRKPSGDKDVILTLEEVKKILNYLKINNFKYYLIFRTMAETGMRKGEIINIDCENVDLMNRTIKTTGKTGEKSYYISKELANYLNIYMAERELKKLSTKAFFLSKGLYRYSSRAFNLYLKKITKIDEINLDKKITCHTFRKTINTLRFNMGCPDGDLEFLLGHSISVNRDFYVKLNPKQKLDLFDKWNPFLQLNL